MVIIMNMDFLFGVVWNAIDEYYDKWRLRRRQDRRDFQRYALVFSSIILKDFRLLSRVKSIIRAENICDDYTKAFVGGRKSEKMPHYLEGDRTELYYMAYGVLLDQLPVSYNKRIKKAIEEIIDFGELKNEQFLNDVVDALVFVSWSGLWDKDYDAYLSYALTELYKKGDENAEVQLWRLTGKYNNIKMLRRYPSSWVVAYWVVNGD